MRPPRSSSSSTRCGGCGPSLPHDAAGGRPFSSSRGGWGQSPLRIEGDEIHRGTMVVVKGTTTAESTAAYGILGVWVKLNRVSLPQPTLAPITNPSPMSGSRMTRSSAPSRPTRTTRALPPPPLRIPSRCFCA